MSRVKFSLNQPEDAMRDWAREENDRHQKNLKIANQHIGALEYLVKQFIAKSKDKHLIRIAKQALEAKT